jgi:hypothetical protein
MNELKNAPICCAHKSQQKDKCQLTVDLSKPLLPLPMYEIQLPHLTTDMRNLGHRKAPSSAVFPLIVLFSRSISLCAYILISLCRTLQGGDPTRNRNSYLSSTGRREGKKIQSPGCWATRRGNRSIGRRVLTGVVPFWDLMSIFPVEIRACAIMDKNVVF